jgi:phosphatidylglycerophosphate synthase
VERKSKEYGKKRTTVKITWIMNLANAFSIYRIGAAPVLVYLAYKDLRLLFASMFVISLFTDMLDGYVARKWKITSKLGSQLDSVGDALTFVAGLIGAWFLEREFIQEHLTLVLVAFLPYLLQIGLAIAVYGRPSSFHTYLAKAAALLQGVFLIILFFYGPLLWLFYLAAIVTILEIVEEIVLVFLIPKWKTDVKGLYWVLKNRGKKHGHAH